jgi:hypothetical protein
MPVEDWARRKAVSRMVIAPDMTPAEASEFSWGIVHAFSALLSDEAVEAAARAIWEYTPEKHEKSWEYGPMRAALQAAINAVTEGDTE